MKEYYSYLLAIYIFSLIYEVAFLLNLKRKGELRRRDNGMTELLANLQTAAPVLTIMFSSFAGVGIVAAIIAYCLERYPKAGAWADKLIGCDYPVDVKTYNKEN